VIEHEGLHFEVLEIEGSRIDRLAVRFVTDPERVDDVSSAGS
jgi:CBS domain containing-hemolysin-like protein